ncbi:O-antigen ligase family protein [Hyphomonas polymorpha]|uniref:O-antigen ligase family protein n=1 Tax=Hyphomonas polymorpha TaxID=74319 RepID=UPI0012F84E23|nr:hypothetical protein [Hyphomonas polymorpha]
MGLRAAVHRIHEPVEAVESLYVNDTHNDYLELVLEMGLPGLIVLAAGMVLWFGLSGIHWIRRRDGNSAQKAPSLTILFLLAHSAVDYPFRTPALACLFALACGLMAPSSSRSPSGGGSVSPDTDMVEFTHINIEI